MAYTLPRVIQTPSPNYSPTVKVLLEIDNDI
jgi:hypothetical protein